MLLNLSKCGDFFTSDFFPLLKGVRLLKLTASLIVRFLDDLAVLIVLLNLPDFFICVFIVKMIDNLNSKKKTITKTIELF